MELNWTSFLDILKAVNTINRDNGRLFTKTGKLDAITNLVWQTDYRRVNAQGLFHLYARKPLCEISEPLIVLSSHIDCEKNMTKCFCEADEKHLKGTFDNSLTNAVAVYLMTEGCLRENVVIAFTGDEESGSRGAKELTKYLKRCKKEFRVIVLDVTHMGWKKEFEISIENNFWSEKFGKRIIEEAMQSNAKWCFVPSDVHEIPDYVPKEHTIRIEAEGDESWEYDEYGVSCCSFCIPVKGDMHSNEGVKVRKCSVEKYAEFLARMCS